MLPNVGPTEMLVIAAVALLLFGDRLPSVMKSLGKGVIEFKKGLRGIESELDAAASKRPAIYRNEIDDREETTAPRFEPPPDANVEEPSDGVQKLA